MMTMRDAIMKNSVLANAVRQNEARRRQAAQQRDVRRAKAQRDAAIVALIKARKSKRKSRHLREQVLVMVAVVREAQDALVMG